MQFIFHLKDNRQFAAGYSGAYQNARGARWNELSAVQKRVILNRSLFLIQLLDDPAKNEFDQVFKAGLFLLFILTGVDYLLCMQQIILRAESEIFNATQDQQLAHCICQCFNPSVALRPSMTDIELSLLRYKISV